MELGNMVFGNSRGEYPIPRGDGWEDELSRLFDSYADKRDTSWRDYGEEYENETFEVMRYYWGDCECDDEYNHDNDCLAMKPNFLYKTNRFSIQWYKYPLRDSYMSADITLEQFTEIIDACIESVGHPANEN